MHLRFALMLSVLLTISACGSDDRPDATTAAEPSDQALDMEVRAGEPFPPDRCEANRAAGPITFLTGFDFAAAASIIEVVVADEAGYYEELCLDVTLLPGFSASNYPLVAAGNAQFASGGSFSEVVNFANANQADFVVLSTDGRIAIDALIMMPGVAEDLADVAGTTIGVKTKLPSSVEAMLLGAGLTEGEDFETVLLEGFDPLAHFELEIDGLPGWKSNEVGTLERAGVGFDLFDPTDFGVPGSFGVIFSSRGFVDDHPTAAEDFMRATFRGLADAVADPAAATAEAIAAIEEGGNPSFLSLETETFRWESEADLITGTTPEELGLGVPDALGLQSELDSYAEVGLFGDGETPTAPDFLAVELSSSLYRDGELVWPG